MVRAMGIFHDKHFHMHQTVAPAYPQTIHEHRAPTDESVKALREMEDAARDSILDVYRMEDNALNGIVVLLKARNPHDFSRSLYVQFSLNGKQFRFERKLDSLLSEFNKHKALELLMHGIRDAILEELISHIGEAVG